MLMLKIAKEFEFSCKIKRKAFFLLSLVADGHCTWRLQMSWTFNHCTFSKFEIYFKKNQRSCKFWPFDSSVSWGFLEIISEDAIEALYPGLRDVSLKKGLNILKKKSFVEQFMKYALKKAINFSNRPNRVKPKIQD